MARGHRAHTLTPTHTHALQATVAATICWPVRPSVRPSVHPSIPASFCLSDSPSGHRLVRQSAKWQGNIRYSSIKIIAPGHQTTTTTTTTMTTTTTTTCTNPSSSSSSSSPVWFPMRRQVVAALVTHILVPHLGDLAWFEDLKMNRPDCSHPVDKQLIIFILILFFSLPLYLSPVLASTFWGVTAASLCAALFPSTRV